MDSCYLSYSEILPSCSFSFDSSDLDSRINFSLRGISFNERSAFNCIFHSLIFCFIAVLAFSLTAGVKPTKNFPSLFLFSLALAIYAFAS